MYGRDSGVGARGSDRAEHGHVCAAFTVFRGKGLVRSRSKLPRQQVCWMLAYIDGHEWISQSRLLGAGVTGGRIASPLTAIGACLT